MDLYCEKCHKTMDEKNFYNSNNLEKYPKGKVSKCKKCFTMHVDNYNPETYLPLLEECDVPYVPEEWNKALLKWGQDPSKLTGVSIIGRYLSKMKLNQWKDWRWKDTEYLQQQANHKIEETMKRQGYDAQQIAEVIQKGAVQAPERPANLEASQTDFAQDLFQQANDIENAMVADLTEEDHRYLCLKWGKTYRPDEWVRLEQLYEEMMQSYDIQGAGHIDTLKLVCKTSLKANQLLDIGDVDGAQKMLKMYDAMMKSGKFTAAQNKAEQGEYVDSVSEIVKLCEEQGFIPRYYTDGPQDKVDKVLLDTQQYVRNLVTEEMGLGAMIENAFKLLREEQESIAAAGENSLDEDEDLFDYDKDTIELQDKDYIALKEIEELESTQDDEFLKSLMEVEEE